METVGDCAHPPDTICSEAGDARVTQCDSPAGKGCGTVREWHVTGPPR